MWIELFRVVIEPIVRRALEDEVPDDLTHELLDEAFADYHARRQELRREASRGGELMLHLAALTASLYRALLAALHDEARARRLTSQVTWAAYKKMAVMPTVVSRAASPDPLVRLRRATDTFRRSPFSPPAYIMEDVNAGPDVVAFDVVRCPVAEYFVGEGLEDLCAESWCDLDFPLARRWGGWLERDTTLVRGADRCTFRWRAGAPPESVADRHLEPGAAVAKEDVEGVPDDAA